MKKTNETSTICVESPLLSPGLSNVSKKNATDLAEDLITIARTINEQANK